VFVRAAQQAGLPFNSDFNGVAQAGAGLYQTTTRNGRRCSAATGYLANFGVVQLARPSALPESYGGGARFAVAM
jgi:choline dehydrogenase-like flavoprotein